MRLGLAALVLGLTVLLALEWTLWSPQLKSNMAAPSTPPAPTPANPDTNELLAQLDSGEERDNYALITERPLFRPDRQPDPPSDAQAITPPSAEGAPLDALDLKAVLIMPETALAWVHDPAQPRVRRLRVGDEVQGWVVRAILEDRILVERQGQQDALLLRDYTKAPPTAAPPTTRPIPPRTPPRAPQRTAPKPP
ncbi:hypothetical protein GWK36_00180 [Caldichromatium japonicum]|uniref:Uncharacterized protein n=1 Tax=Caldichromatium japonicum TaxID=2699430 RepID=A0A6G7V9Y9_9GAMM|nr:type II secretion system protein N [Caldichromatium japonicum]QIK36676.1 hypothetical protein GWK36_00180 [Caldichromatium japonicum]